MIKHCMWYDDDDDDDNSDGHLLQLLYEAEAYSFKLNDNKCNMQIYEAQLLFCGKKGWNHEHMSVYVDY